MAPQQFHNLVQLMYSLIKIIPIKGIIRYRYESKITFCRIFTLKKNNKQKKQFICRQSPRLYGSPPSTILGFGEVVFFIQQDKGKGPSVRLSFVYNITVRYLSRTLLHGVRIFLLPLVLTRQGTFEPTRNLHQTGIGNCFYNEDVQVAISTF